MTLQDLLDSHCMPLDASQRLDTAAMTPYLQLLDGWRFEDGSIRKTYVFGNYYQNLAFVNALAWMVHREDHHPDLLVQYNRCSVAFNTHSAGGITRNDFVCAAKADAVYAQGATR
ncbi:MAG: 4a-hydroxytetrahydrobiopterin dehydratase [Thiomonas sp.]|jgi:4a-hydroxytetrahydrobiopterin dehydratase|uniref:4a-hydroxytetrahydrobiopterin dehydratase n=1 Tax=Thiomonas TaxID=32012 RepID=UPI000AF2FA4A|nr:MULTISPECIES: 4a-hydroxytetrahydrobiopterin dehydratase [Thiomonas]MBN8775385.1 4a-hydroxytetrahydrobiopterin dehydratase [Thiomonas arsenitoxydans]MDE1978613.1 4a-hydroxytetrahydrobiopterin dehydratase [Betaproteobacteria bacterium]MDE2269714.1 4a-hydroxytetrahydrobiopterin dehydratase [Betaproteobacteria bacterium]HML82190.1 4a-hydroxytetrahydrobiopterin dehydratase [Thiomonas arsenitoxydans]